MLFLLMWAIEHVEDLLRARLQEHEELLLSLALPGFSMSFLMSKGFGHGATSVASLRGREERLFCPSEIKIGGPRSAAMFVTAWSTCTSNVVGEALVDVAGVEACCIMQRLALLLGGRAEIAPSTVAMYVGRTMPSGIHYSRALNGHTIDQPTRFPLDQPTRFSLCVPIPLGGPRSRLTHNHEVGFGRTRRIVDGVA